MLRKLFKPKTINRSEAYAPGPATESVPSITYEELTNSFTKITKVLDDNSKILELFPIIKELKELLDDNPNLDSTRIVQLQQRINKLRETPQIETFLTAKLADIPANLPYYYTYLKDNNLKIERVGTYNIITIKEDAGDTVVDVTHLNNLIQWYNQGTYCYNYSKSTEDERIKCIENIIKWTTYIKRNIDEIIKKLKPVNISLGGSTLQKTNLRVQINNQTRVVYLNKYKTQYVKYNNEYMPLSKAKKLEKNKH
jgi:hypothetical protein